MRKFELMKGTKADYFKCDQENRPMVRISDKYGKYKTLEADFITCDWRISSKGQARLQKLLNWDFLFMWISGTNLTVNKTKVGHTVTVIKGNDELIKRFMLHLQQAALVDDYWESRFFSPRYEKVNKEYDVAAPYHLKSNTNKLGVV